MARYKALFNLKLFIMNHLSSHLLSHSDYLWYQLISTRLWEMGNPYKKKQLESSNKNTPNSTDSNHQLKSAFSLLIEKLVVTTKSSGQLCLKIDSTTLFNELTFANISLALPSLFEHINLINIKEKFCTKPIVAIQSDHSNKNYYLLFNQSYNQLLSCIQFIKNKTHDDYQLPNNLFNQINWKINSKTEYSIEQKLAIFSLSSLPFGLLSGGAGTGKSTTLIKIISIILMHQPNAKILLSAPTGKATHRLKELLENTNKNPGDSLKLLLEKVKIQTLHRALGISQTNGAYHHHKNPINYDVVIIDESSMMSLPLFMQLQSSLLKKSRLILVGDANQLSAIDSISLFNLLCKQAATFSSQFTQKLPRHLSDCIKQKTNDDKPTLLSNSLYLLSNVQRYQQQSSINDLATAILNNNYQHILDLPHSVMQPLTNIYELTNHIKNNYLTSKNLVNTIQNSITLCVTKTGTFGSQSINQFIDQFIGEQQHYLHHGLWYEGRPIIIEKNNYHTNVFNGDIGYCKIIDDIVFIEFSDNRILNLMELNNTQYTLAYAISIHKSQGSEYQHVNIILPIEDNHFQPIVDKSILYTAITRAKSSFCLYTNPHNIKYIFTDSASGSQLFNQLIFHYS